jgi:hypothetical protein
MAVRQKGHFNTKLHVSFIGTHHAEKKELLIIAVMDLYYVNEFN